MRLQLDPPRATPLRDKIGKAALAMILLDLPAAAHADSGATTQLDINTLLYGEQNRAQVAEPLIRVTRLFPDGQSLSAQFGLDVITGASPSGALPSGQIQTSTTASGQVVVVGPGEIPTTSFKDQRFGLDGDWTKPLNHTFTSLIGGHFSHEKDYESLGVNGKLTTDLDHKLLTLSFGGGYNHDSVFPTGGTPEGLSDGSILVSRSNPKQVTSLLFGVSRVLTRRWMLSFDASRVFESGYLTEPYKVISLMDPITGVPTGQLTDKRPDSRDRTSLLFSSVYHLTKDVIYVSYRHYRDTWELRSNTFDLKFRHQLGDTWYLEPHVRYYKQTQASFYTAGLIDGVPLPDFATADYRLGPLKTMTLGGTLGFHVGDYPGEWNVRAEYIRQTGDSHPMDVVGVQQDFDLAPPLNIVAVVVGYSIGF